MYQMPVAEVMALAEDGCGEAAALLDRTLTPAQQAAWAADPNVVPTLAQATACASAMAA